LSRWGREKWSKIGAKFLALFFCCIFWGGVKNFITFLGQKWQKWGQKLNKNGVKN